MNVRTELRFTWHPVSLPKQNHCTLALSSTSLRDDPNLFCRVEVQDTAVRQVGGSRNPEKTLEDVADHRAFFFSREESTELELSGPYALHGSAEARGQFNRFRL